MDAGARDDASADADAAVGGGPWTLARVSSASVELGEWLRFEVDGVRASELPIMLHIEGHEAPYPILIARRVSSGEPMADGGAVDAGAPLDGGADTDAPASYDLVTVLPVREGMYRVALGDDEEPKTEWRSIEVVPPSRRLEPTVVGATMQAGLAAMVTDTRTMLAGTDPETSEAMSELITTEERATFDAALTELEALASDVGAQYGEMTSEDERFVQALYVNTGIYDAMVASRDGDMARALDFRAIPFVDRLAAYANRPLQALLFTLDTFSFLLSALSTVCDVIGIATAITGVGLPAAATAVATKLVVAFLKVAFDTFMPIDLLDIVVHGQPRLFHREGGRFLHWGKFGPQNATGATLRSLEDLALVALAEAVPAGAALPARMVATRVVGAARAALRYVAERIPGAGVEAFLNATFPDNLRTTGLYTAIDLRVYRLRLSEVLSLVPLAGWMVASTLSLFWDPAVVEPLALTAVSPPAWGRSAELVADYAIADIDIRGIAYPGTSVTETAFVNIESSGWHFATVGSVVQVPWPETITARLDPVAVQRAPDPMANELGTDEYVVYDRIGLADGSTKSFVLRNTTTERYYDIVLRDQAGFTFDNTTVTILVNGTPAVTDARIVNDAPIPLSLRPGLNEVVLVAGEAEPLPCSSRSVHWCVAVGFPSAMNADVARDVDLEPGETFTFHVWTPPQLR